MNIDYITKDDTIIFSPNFNKPLDQEMLFNYKKIIFSDYVLDDNLFERYENNNLQNLKRICSNFNQSINNLPSTITHLTFDPFSYFNQSINNLPPTITNLTFGLPRKLTQVNFLEPHKIFYKILLEVIVLINLLIIYLPP